MPDRSAKTRVVLLVEDEQNQREALVEFLSWQDFAVIAFANGRDAVDWLRDEPAKVDVAIIDWHLPGIGGQGVIACIRDRFPSLPVIVASGSPLSAAERRSATWSVALRKPFSMRRLTVLIGELLDGAPLP